MRTSFHHQPEAQHPKSPAIETPAGRLPHLWVKSGQTIAGENPTLSALVQKRTNAGTVGLSAKCQQRPFALRKTVIFLCQSEIALLIEPARAAPLITARIDSVLWHPARCL